jgi:hypothetical protein
MKDEGRCMMATTRLVEVETIDCVIEQLKHVRDRYEGEYDEQGAELAYAIQQRDVLLAVVEELTQHNPLIHNLPYSIINKAHAAIAKIEEGA